MKNKDRYFVELYTGNLLRKIKIDKLYFEGQTKYQKVFCFSNEYLGKTLFLDNEIQSAQIDEYVYHESLVHPALLVHPSPKEVLVIGGGEGATIREVLRHSSIQKVTMVDIDKELVEICQKYMPEWSDGAFADKRTDCRPFKTEKNSKPEILSSRTPQRLIRLASLFGKSPEECRGFN